MSTDPIVLAIKQYVAQHHAPPTYREIAEICGISPQAVHKRVMRLRIDGVITTEPGFARSIRIKDHPMTDEPEAMA